MLAKNVNDDAFIQDKRGGVETIVGTPPGASSLLQKHQGIGGVVARDACVKETPTLCKPEERQDNHDNHN
ncbi:hypothetical protein [Pseudomonas silesiensis]|uniref:hypothetical protein n=1 Tax=Pseudomonas silesiensis TaxID=1853130 RepID=UPI0030D9A2BF